MKKLINKDKKHRQCSYNYLYYRYILKNIVLNKNIFFSLRFNVGLKLFCLPKVSSQHINSNRCVLTGRKKSIVSRFKLSRIMLLKFCRLGWVSGLKKAVW